MMNATKRQLALLKSLCAPKGRRDSGLFLVEGARSCTDLLASTLPVDCLLISDSVATRPGPAALAQQAVSQGVPVLHAPDPAVQRVSATVHGQGVVAAATWRDSSWTDWRIPHRAVIVALDAVSDPGNVGTVIRAAAWFGATGVILGEDCADPCNPKVVRSSMGGLFHVPVCRRVPLPEALGTLRSQGFRVTVAAMDGETNWRDWAEPDRSVLVLGNEARGVGPRVRSLADRIAAIPGAGQGESLNVAVTAGIFLAATHPTSGQAN